MTQTKAAARLRLAIVPVVVLVSVLAAWKLGFFELDSRRVLVERVQRLRVVNGIEVVYIASYTLVVMVCLPATAVTVLGGAIFGPWIGALLAWIGSMAGTIVTHWVARTVARKPMTRLFGEHLLLRRLREHDSVLELFRLRVLPVAPFGVLDYVAGIAGVSLRRLLVATAMGVSLNVIAYAFVGHTLLRGLVTESGGANRALWIAGGVSLGMLALSLVPRVLKRHPQ